MIASDNSGPAQAGKLAARSRIVKRTGKTERPEDAGLALQLSDFRLRFLSPSC